MDPTTFRGLDVDRAFVLALTECSMGDSHSTTMCGTIIADALSRGQMDDQAMYSIMVFINKVVLRWARRCRWATAGPTPRITDPIAAAAFSALLSHGATLHTPGLVVMRYLMDWLVQYSTVIVCEEVGTWLARPGFTVVVELLQRGEHCPRGRTQLVTSVWTCTQSTLSVLKVMIGGITSGTHPSGPPFSTILRGTISLSGTLRKIVRRTEKRDDLTVAWSDLDYGKLTESCKVLCDTVHTLLFLHAIGEEAQGQAEAEAQAQAPQAGPRRSLDAILRLAKLLHVSSQGMMRTLIRARGPVADFRGTLAYYDRCELGKLDGLARMFELFVALDGRVLPGCCNPTCDNLSGVSEVALETLLCGGCRRSRYCSRWCQRQDRRSGHDAACHV